MTQTLKPCTCTITLTTPKNLKIGDKVKLKKLLCSIGSYFEKGTVVTICEIDKEKGYGVMDDRGCKIIECGWDIGESYEDRVSISLAEYNKMVEYIKKLENAGELK